MSDIRHSPTSAPGDETPRFTPQEGLGANPTTREGAAQPRVTDRHVPMPERPLGATAARQGQTLGHVRWVLLISLVLAIVAMVAVYLFI
jgi:hypothetical protein